MRSRIALPQPRAARLPRLAAPVWRAGRRRSWRSPRCSSAAGCGCATPRSCASSSVHVTGASGFGERRRALGARGRRARDDDAARRRGRAARRRRPLPARRATSQATPDLPHGLRIRSSSACRSARSSRRRRTRVAVADDGTLLRGVPTAGAARDRAGVPPGGARVARPPHARRRSRVLAAAPAELRARITARDARPLRPARRACATARAALRRRHRACAPSGSPPSASCATPAPPRPTYLDVASPSARSPAGSPMDQGGAPEGVSSSVDPQVVASADAARPWRRPDDRPPDGRPGRPRPPRRDHADSGDDRPHRDGRHADPLATTP